MQNKKLLAAVFALLSITNAWAAAEKPHRPTHVVFMVFDQMRPDYIDRYNLTNFKALRKKSENYVNGYVGHMASVTVVSHMVMNTGRLPKDLPWQDDMMTDSDGALGKARLNYETPGLTVDQFFKLLKSVPEDQVLTTALKEKLDGDVISIGEKNYAAIAFGGPYATRIITLEKKDGRCSPFGVKVPEYISKNDRFSIDCSKKFGTELAIYPLDGNHYYPGEDKAHLGGDVWTADAAIEVMNHENWRGLLLTFGGIDKISHMTGEEDVKMPRPYETPIDLEKACRIADEQLGKILAELKNKKLSESTLIIVTADHAGQSNTIYLGNEAGETLGHSENGKDEPPPFWLKRIENTKLVHLASFDTGIRIWLKEVNDENIKTIANVAREISGVTRIVSRGKGAGDYKSIFENFNRTTAAYSKWAKTHDIELANTMAAKNGPDVIVYLNDGVGFGRLGNHGGAQEKVQRIPMLIYDPTSGGSSGKINTKPLRLVDLKDLILKKIGQ